MPLFRAVDTYPATDDPGAAATHAAGVGVCAVFSAGLREAGISTRLSYARVYLRSTDERDDDGRVHVAEVFDAKEGFDGSPAVLPRGMEELSVEARAMLVLDIVCAMAERLALLRGWEPGAVAAAREYALGQGLTFVWSSPWKASRDRRHRARATYGIGADGEGVAAIEIRRAGEVEPFTWSRRARAFHTYEGFRRSARTLRWSAPGEVDLIPYAGLFGERRGPVHHAVDTAPAQLDELIRPTSRPADVERPEVVVDVPDPDARTIVPMGGGPDSDVPSTWLDELNRLWDQMTTAAWQRWWAPAGVPTLELWWMAYADVDRVVVRRGEGKLVARIERRPGSVAASEGAEVARRDMESLVAAVRRRERLGEPPAFES